MANEKKRYYTHLITSFLICVMLLIIAGSACHRPPQRYDGSWWVLTPQDQQLGFIDGYVDCYTYGSSINEKLWRPRSWYQTAISTYYKTHGADESMLVGKVLVRVAETAESSSPVRPEKNKIFDGIAWLSYSNKERLGFVEGYLNAVMPQGSRSVTFPRGPEYYVDAISKSYGTQNNSASGDAKVRRIAEVLWSMRNAPAKK
jgi:hypothetical protein